MSLREVKVGQRRRGLLSTVLYFVFALKHSEPLLPLIIIREVWRRLRHPHKSGKTLVLHLPLIFVNAKFILSWGLKISYHYASKDLKLFFFSKGICDINNCFCVANQTTWRKNLSCFWKGSTNHDHYGSIWQFILMNF